MSLADLFNQEKDFNPAEDALQDDGLPEGDYLVIVENISHYVNKESGNESFRMSFEVMEGEKIGANESAFLTFNETKSDGTAMPQFVLTRNIRTVQRLAWATGVELSENDFEGLETLAPAFINAKGKYLMLKVMKTKSKKGDVFTNYDFDQAEQPAGYFGDEIEISDDDVPF